jgi:hypothetical protein
MRMATLASAALVAFVLTCTWLAPSAVAEPVSLAEMPLEVQIWPGGEMGYTLFIVTGHLPADAPLPTTVHLPIPEGVEVLWSGEIFGGGDSSKDAERPHVMVQAQHGTMLEMTAEATRTVQYEAVGAPLTIEDGLTTSVFEWEQTVKTGDVVFSVRVPTAAGGLRIEPEPVGSPRTNNRGESLYTLKPAVLPLGEKYVVTTSYGPARQDGAQAGGSPLLPVLLGLLALALVALAGALVLSKRQRTRV